MIISTNIDKNDQDGISTKDKIKFIIKIVLILSITEGLKVFHI